MRGRGLVHAGYENKEQFVNLEREKNNFNFIIQ